MSPGALDGRVAVVTGAGSGIGRATATRLAADGAQVIALDVDAAAAEATVETLGAAGVAAGCDVTDAEAVRQTVAAAVRRFGGIDAVANVAGIGSAAQIHEIDLDTWNRTIAVNLTGTFLVCQAALPHLEARGGSIVNVASLAGVRGIAYAAAYAASKGGVVALSRALAVELRDRGVRVNCVCPGGVDTPMVEQFRLPEGAPVPGRSGGSGRRQLAPPEQVAGVIAYLLSDAASGVSGATLLADGGASGHPA